MEEYLKLTEIFKELKDYVFEKLKKGDFYICDFDYRKKHSTYRVNIGSIIFKLKVVLDSDGKCESISIVSWKENFGYDNFLVNRGSSNREIIEQFRQKENKMDVSDMEYKIKKLKKRIKKLKKKRDELL